ncbi:CIC11C00000003705 [Sungouiella intermedia]|uniref:CIC11C00000003705 n=1 Tax=Sungouiella intermedia TaxID=45354 RepID=A0A1L0FRP7_9ASCO|nr:CIC11C00000003705 [[Candida] intermedia]
MFKSSISKQFFSDDPSFAADANSTIEQFSTPLKKLPNSSINDFRNDILHPPTEFSSNIATDSPLSSLSARSAESALSAAENQRSQLYKLISESSTMGSKPSSISSSILRSDFPVHLNEKYNSSTSSSLFATSKDMESKANGAVFYKPLSIEGPLLSKDFIPPPLQQSGRNPIVSSLIYQTVNPNADFEDLEDDNDDIQTSPTGEWTSPVVIEALRRQVNKERIFKRVRANVLRFLGFHLVLLFVAYFFKLYQIKFYDENKLYRNDSWSQFERLQFVQTITGAFHKTAVYVHHVQWLFVLQIIWGTIELLRPQDQCADLPLTNKQRKLIGLKQINFGEDQDELKADLVIKERLFESNTHNPIRVPKYRQLNEFQKQLHRDTRPLQESEEDAAIALSNVLPTRRIFHSGRPIDL